MCLISAMHFGKIRLWLRLARRDLQAGAQGLRVFMIALVLATTAMAAVGVLAAGFARGLSEQGRVLLGGDIEITLIHREATPQERAFLQSLGELSEIATLRGMVRANDTPILAEIKAIDQSYPLYGTVALHNSGSIEKNLAAQGAFSDPVLAERLNAQIGQSILLGKTELVLRNIINAEPDRIASGLLLGPRLFINLDTLRSSDLIAPGSLIKWSYRLKLGPESQLADIVAKIKNKFPNAGWGLKDRDNVSQSTLGILAQLENFLVLAALTGLFTAGIGIANAVSAFITRRTASIATFKCLGIRNSDIFGLYLTEIILAGSFAIALGLMIGASTPLLINGFFATILPLPLSTHVAVLPLILTAAFGILIMLGSAIWPLARIRQVPASALLRHAIAPPNGRPQFIDLMIIGIIVLSIALLCFIGFKNRLLSLIYLISLLIGLVGLGGLGLGLKKVISYLPNPRSILWRYALRNITRPGSAAISIILALGLGLMFFVTLKLVNETISQEISAVAPSSAPSFYFVDVQKDDLQPFVSLLRASPGFISSRAEPMLRGRIVAIGEKPAATIQLAEDKAWILREDRGLSFSDNIPEDGKITAGQWWPQNYEGPPLVSLADDVATSLGLKIGNMLTLNILGREIKVQIANLRHVEWRRLGINFIMILSPNTLRDAPYNYLVTTKLAQGHEAQLLKDIAQTFPSITAIDVKDVLLIVGELIGKILIALQAANLFTLLMGGIVLAGAVTTSLNNRLYDAVILKIAGVRKYQLLVSLIIEYALLGLVAALFGICGGIAISWILSQRVFNLNWHFSLSTALMTALLGVVFTIFFGLLGTWRALSVKPALYLRDE